MAARAKPTSCGVIVTDRVRLLLGHASRSPRWDIPKGLADPDEPFVAAAVREVLEETGLQVNPAELRPLGTYAYLRDKDLALFAWFPPVMPDPTSLRCSSLVQLPGGMSIPELDRFGLFEFDAGLALVGRNLSRVLTAVWPMIVT
jgi:putative (di)nucleoside polyphosphate hydrolase